MQKVKGKEKLKNRIRVPFDNFEEEEFKDIISDYGPQKIINIDDILCNINNIDENFSDNDENIDSDILNELHELTQTDVLSNDYELKNIVSNRIKNYQEALENAIKNTDFSKKRRIERGLSTLKQMLIDLHLNKRNFTKSDIPPPVSLGKSIVIKDLNICDNKQNILTELPINDEFSKNLVENKVDVINDDNININKILSQQLEFKEQALIAKQNDDISLGRKFLHVYKQYQSVLDEIILNDNKISGSPIIIEKILKLPTLAEYISQPDDNMNSTPTDNITFDSKPDFKIDPIQTAHSPNLMTEPIDVMPSKPPDTQLEKNKSEISQHGVNGLISQLELRMKMYLESQESADKEGNSSKARRMGRIVKQYTDAIEAIKKGNSKSYPFFELPNPPNLPELEYNNYIQTEVQNFSTKLVNNNERKSIGASKPSTIKSASPHSRLTDQTLSNLKILADRQNDYKQAALLAKKEGNLTQAKEYLRLMKGFDPLIEACKSGLPVNMSGIPAVPQILSSNKSPVSSEKQSLTSPGHNSQNIPLTLKRNIDIEDAVDHQTIRENINEYVHMFEEKLNDQILLCQRNSKYFMQCGDVSSARNFDSLATRSAKDLEKLLAILRVKGDVNFRFEDKIVSLVKSNVELGDNDFELTISRGYHYDSTASKEMDTYVEYELPYPNQSNPQKGKTIVVYGTNNPEYNQTFKLSIDRNSRSLARFLKRHHLTFRIYVKGGLMRLISGDRLLGTATVKLNPFETEACTIHTCSNVVFNRKEVGKLEILVKIRDPIHRKDIEEIKKEWLYIT